MRRTAASEVSISASYIKLFCAQLILFNEKKPKNSTVAFMGKYGGQKIEEKKKKAVN